MALTVLQLQLQVLVLVLVLNLVLPASASHYMSARSTYHILGVDHRGNQMVSGVILCLLLYNFVDFQPVERKIKLILLIN